MKKRHQQPNAISEASTASILESISDGVFTVDGEWRITSFNRAAEEITGVKRKDAIGRLCSELFKSDMCESGCALKKTIDTGKPVIGKSGYIKDEYGNSIPISISTAVLRDAEGKAIGGAETFRDLSELESLRHKLKEGFHLGEITSHSQLMQRIFEIIPTIATSLSNVLVTGETGTGKELVARTIHSMSLRSRGPFVAINCAALPDSLLESELFGYKAGAFTGANRDKPGRFALASGGTIFLDEIGEISPALQARLLRVLQERTYEPLGSTSSETADVRLIVATNRELSAMIREGKFREDLYYRINVIRIELPPLRRRKEDIPLLTNQFISKFNKIHNRAVGDVSPEALSLLMAHDWPGNIRELQNVVERGVVLSTGSSIEITNLPEEMKFRKGSQDTTQNMRKARTIVESEVIANALVRNGFNRMAAAKDLGIHKSTFFRKMKKLGIKPHRQ